MSCGAEASCLAQVKGRCHRTLQQKMAACPRQQQRAGAAAVGADDEASLCGALFRGLVFFLGREVPREALLLVIRCADETPELLVQKCRSTACECWLLYALYRRHEIADDITLTWSAEGLTTQTRSAFSLQDTYCLSRGLA